MNIKETRYGQWPGDPQGRAYVSGQCAEEVPNSEGWGFHQCYRKAGHGQESLFCWQHKNSQIAGLRKEAQGD